MKIKLDELLSQLGDSGRYQIFIFILLCLNYFPLVFNHVIMAFLGARPKHQCHSMPFFNTSMVSNSVDDFSEILDYYHGNGTFGEFKSCQSIYTVPGHRNVTVTCPESKGSVVIYKKTELESTIVTEWDLVCDQKYLSSLATTIYFCGVMVGGVLFGHLADKFGRKPVMLTCIYMPVIVGVATAFSPWYSIFVGLRFIQGILMQGLQITTYTLAMELFLPKYRSYAGAILECFWGLTVMMLPLLAYLVRDWRYLQLAVALPSVFAIFYICVIPESIRWLIMKTKIEQAESLITKVANFNRVAFPERHWEDVKLQLGLDGQNDKQFSFIDTVRTPVLRKRSLILFYLWFAISVGYYGLTWTLTMLPGNKYLNFFLAAAVEFLAYTLVIYITKRFGRKKPLLVYFMLASLFNIMAGGVMLIKPEMRYLMSGLAIAGKFAMGGLFSVIFLYTSELYPTMIRNIGMGSCTFWTRVGGVLAPQIVGLNKFGVPMVIFGTVTLIGGFLTIMLPETLRCKLPDTIEEVEDEVCHDNIVDGNMEELKRLEDRAEV